MKTGNAWVWAVYAALAALINLAPLQHAAAHEDPATGVVGTAPLSASSVQEEPLDFAATGVDPSGSAADETAQSAAEAPPVEDYSANVERSGVIVGQSVVEDQPELPTPAATGLSR